MGKKKALASIKVLIILIVLITGMLFFLYKILIPQRTLPVFNPHDIHPDLVDESLQNRYEGHTISDFTLLNQNGETITYEQYRNKIYVADFFFTRCQTICIPMTSNMATIQDVFINDDEIMFLSHSVTPIMDSIPVLRAYADAKGVIDGKWNLATGSKKHIYELARKSYFAVLDEGDGDLQDFIHTERFILVDKKRQIRGFYDGTDSEDMKRLVNDIKLLKKE